jgi:hypothetical protein
MSIEGFESVKLTGQELAQVLHESRTIGKTDRRGNPGYCKGSFSYTLYSPPNHRDGVVHHTRAEAEKDNEHFDGKTTE